VSTEELIYSKMHKSIEEYDSDAAIAAAKEAVSAGIDPALAIEKGFAEPIRKIGEAFERMDIFLPELVMAANAMKTGVGILEAELKLRGGTVQKKGVVILGTVEGDIHDIGKTVVGAMLQANGYEVHDLGVEVPAPRFIQAAEETKADVIAMSALLSTTMLYQRDVIEMLRNKGKQEEYFIIVGGAPVTQKWADEIGANGFGRDAVDAVRVLDQHHKEWVK
jgi:corrinoid protein of di/trimethylamine methyltransferase